MAVTIISGVFAILLAILSWLLTNGSKRDRLLSRIQRQVAALKDLPTDHPARTALDESVTADATSLRDLGKMAPDSSESGIEWAWWPLASRLALTAAVIIGTTPAIFNTITGR